MLWVLFLLVPGAFSRVKSKRASRRRREILNEMSSASFPRTQEFPIFNPAFLPYLQASEFLDSAYEDRSRRARRRQRSSKRARAKETKRVYAPAAIPAVAIPAEELRIDGLPAGMDHVVIDRPEVPQIPTPTPMPTRTPLPSGAPPWLYREVRVPSPTPTPYPVGIALGMIPVPNDE